QHVPAPKPLANGNGIAAHRSDLWYAASNTNGLWRYNAPADQFTEFVAPTPAATPFDVAVAADGIVWFTGAAGAIGRLDPQSGTITETPVPGGRPPRQIAIATDGSVWFTERFNNAVGRLDPATNAVTEFPLAPGGG